MGRFRLDRIVPALSDMALLHEELTERIIGIYHDVYTELGPGFLEKIYQRAMIIALTQAGFSVAQRVPYSVMFRGHCSASSTSTS